MRKKKTDYNIKVAAQAFYLEEQSDPEQDRYVFAYTVVIQNQGSIAARLLSRHWIMRGSYQMLADDGMTFNADIPPFVLSIPRTLH